MSEPTSYSAQATSAAKAAIAKGHADPESLRELLIWTTCTSTSDMIEGYFAHHRLDESLLADLVAIALEGEDAGDAPWAAANVLAEFPAPLLNGHRPQLEELSKHQWSYLHIPARAALAKLGQDSQ